jgi:hypothetical protein
MFILSVLFGVLGMTCLWAFNESIKDEHEHSNVHYTNKEFTIILGVFLLFAGGMFLYLALWVWL